MPSQTSQRQKQQTLARFFGGKSKAAPSPSPSTAGEGEGSDVKPELKEEDESSKKRITPPTSSEDLELETTPKIKKAKVDEETIKHKLMIDEAEKLIELETDEKEDTKPQVKNNEPIAYLELCTVFEKLENEPGRLKNLAIVSEFFLHVLKLTSGDITQQIHNLTQVTYLMINRLGPDYEPGLELGLGETILIKALANGTGRSTQQIKSDYHELGDIGVVALKSRSKQSLMFKPKPLNIDQVFNNLSEIAKSTGNSSQAKKIGIINKMLTCCEGQEAKFLMRSLEGKLRINFGEKSVLVALSKAIVEYQNEDKKLKPELLVYAEEQIKDAFSQTPNYEIIITNALKYGIRNLMDHCTLKAGIPLKPMLAKPTKSITEILDQFQNTEFTCEYKYDGERAQLHLLPNGDLRIYSRNSEDMTERYPDLVGVVKELKSLNPNINSLILDCECVAWDVTTKKILPFQVLSTRKRKDVQEKDIKVQVCLFAFDVLLYNEESLIKKSLKDRRKVMFDELKTIEGKFQYTQQMDSSNLDDISKFLDQSVKDSCEGLMIKSLNGTESYYEPSKRSRNWLKLKKDYLEGVGDSLDLVVIGAYIGKGKRTGWYGGFLLASYNQDTGEYESICKIGTGFSEELLANLAEKLKPTETDKPKASIVYDKENSNAKPDVWLEPSIVFEVKVADLTESPTYKSGAGLFGDGSKGISLRFPRFIRLRDDKGIEDATSSDQIVEMYQSQAVIN
ncbi:hypothetical protein CANARDRAFT_30439 [[Candida] arabinofermentans NRRL YB-2248]|uniref:DNA ligase n=1 Tax=[Candida] arabinofermentans NRRL YB-2248 TaxID=983967 RepID=A0A1E4STY4_9ASCO|nr:hypothetical protein CANARDRAFT_30439 [[Candida] arabinofermentans NRRL YB-2248]